MTSGELESVSPDHAQAIYNAMAAYRECVESCAVLLLRRGFTGLSPEDVATLGTGIEHVLAKAVKPHIDFFAPYGAEVTISDDGKWFWEMVSDYSHERGFYASIEPPVIVFPGGE